MKQSVVTETAGILAVDILRNDFHRPLVGGKANRENIEDQITIGILSGGLEYEVDQEVVDLAIVVINDLLETHGAKNADDTRLAT